MFVRLPIAIDPQAFGRGMQRAGVPALAPTQSRLSADLKLFATTFVAGFIFVSVYLA